MYDTVSMTLHTDEGFRVAEHLSNVRSYPDSNGEALVKGRLKNLLCQISSTRVRITGSLAKFHLGNNLEQLTRQETQRAVECLSERLSLPMEKASVFRLDVGATFIMERPCSEYVKALGDSRFYKRIDYNGESVEYRGKKKSLLLYDKALELQAHKEAIPEAYSGKNVLRYEQQHKKGLRQGFKVGEITVAKLYEEKFYRLALSRWQEAYLSINKHRVRRISDVLPTKDVRRFVEHWACLGIESAGGALMILPMIKEAQKSGILDKAQAKRLREKVRSISNAKCLTEESTAIQELDGKIRNTVQCGREEII